MTGIVEIEDFWQSKISAKANPVIEAYISDKLTRASPEIKEAARTLGKWLALSIQEDDWHLAENPIIAEKLQSATLEVMTRFQDIGVEREKIGGFAVSVSENLRVALTQKLTGRDHTLRYKHGKSGPDNAIG